MTVLETIQRATEFLGRKGVDSPRLQAELLLAHVLKLARMRLYLEFERVLTETETGAMRELVVRRGAREPLQHVLGTAPFCDFEVALNRHVLVPRPETELLAEKGWKFLLELASAGNEGGLRALDFGTGSGCLAIALARHCPAAIVDALDISPEALAVARRNAAANSVGERIRFYEGAGLEALPAGSRYHLLISNPPYIASNEIERLAPEVKDFEPRRALDGGADGLDFYRQLAVAARPCMAEAGRLMVEFGDGQAGQVVRLLEQQNWIVEPPEADYTGRLRLLAARLA